MELAIFHDCCQVFTVSGQHRDVLKGVAVDHQQIRNRARCDNTELAFPTQNLRAYAGRRCNYLVRRQDRLLPGIDQAFRRRTVPVPRHLRSGAYSGGRTWLRRMNSWVCSS